MYVVCLILNLPGSKESVFAMLNPIYTPIPRDAVWPGILVDIALIAVSIAAGVIIKNIITKTKLKKHLDRDH